MVDDQPVPRHAGRYRHGVTVVTAHQSNFLPGASIIHKCLSADVCIWLDEVQYTPGGWTNRNRMPDGSWLTVPVQTGAGFMPINRVRIADEPWRRQTVKTLKQHYGWQDWLHHICDIIERPHKLLVGLNVALLQEAFRAYGVAPEFAFQSHMDDDHPVPIVSDNAHDLRPISGRLARMVAELGGTTYLSGPSGHGYLDEAPFAARGITVDYWQWDRPNVCVLTDLASRRTRRLRVAL